MLYLYDEFKQTTEFKSTSFSTFCKLRSFWVVLSDFRKCQYPTDLLKITCDGELRESCLERKCGVCNLNKKIVCKEFENEQVTFPQ